MVGMGEWPGCVAAPHQVAHDVAGNRTGRRGTAEVDGRAGEAVSECECEC